MAGETILFVIFVCIVTALFFWILHTNRNVLIAFIKSLIESKPAVDDVEADVKDGAANVPADQVSPKAKVAAKFNELFRKPVAVQSDNLKKKSDEISGNKEEYVDIKLESDTEDKEISSPTVVIPSNKDIQV